MDVLKEIEATKFSIGDVEFEVSKLKDERGFLFLEKVRTSLKLSSGAGEQSPDEVGVNILAMVQSISTKDLLEIKSFCELCLKVKLPNTGVSAPYTEIKVLVDGSISPVDYYEIIARVVAVNFIGSIKELMSRFGLKG